MEKQIDEKKIKAILDTIIKSYPGKMLLSKKETAQVLGMETRTFYNISAPGAANRFPVKPVRAGGQKYRIHDLAEYVAGL